MLSFKKNYPASKNPKRVRTAIIERGGAEAIQENGDPERGSTATIERGPISANPHNLSIIYTKRKLGVNPESENLIVQINTKSFFLRNHEMIGQLLATFW